MRKSKEERIIEHGSEVLKELHKVYLEGIGIDEYYKLLKEYKKLYRRYEKTIKLSDNMGNEIMEQNDTLNDSLQYTIKTARNKLLENVSEHRKTKDAYTQYKEKIKQYDEALNESYAQNNKIQKKLNAYIKHFGEINHTFSEDLNTNPKKSEGKLHLNPTEYSNLTIKNIVSLELSKNKENFTIAKLELNDFENMRETIEDNSSVNNFITGTYRYLTNIFLKDIIIHDEMQTFYIIFRDKDEKTIMDLLKKVNRKRKVFNFLITFSVGVTKFVNKKDTEDTFLRRCDRAFQESVETSEIVFR